MAAPGAAPRTLNLGGSLLTPRHFGSSTLSLDCQTRFVHDFRVKAKQQEGRLSSPFQADGVVAISVESFYYF